MNRHSPQKRECAHPSLVRHIMAKKFPANPKNPERICWGCDLYCPADSMSCGNGADRTPHPAELFGEDWDQWQPVVITKMPVVTEAPVKDHPFPPPK